MMFKKPLFAASIIATLGAGTVGVLPAFADESSTEAPVFQDLAAALAEHFNLDVEEVRTVMKEHHEEMKEERAAHEEERLDRLVEEGTLTQEQADALSEKREEMKTAMESMKEMTPDERREAMQEHAEEMKAWADEQGIDLREIFPKPPGGHMRPPESQE